MSTSDTSAKLLNTAQEYIQTRGYNAFSYKDLAQEIGIRTASIHYHFPTKADLGVALMQRYLETLDQALAHIDGTGRTNKSRLKSFIKLYRDTESQAAICLCGSLASDQDTLPGPLQEAVTGYLDRSERWLASRVADGIREGEFQFRGKPGDAAATLLSGLQGGLILARARRTSPVIEAVQRMFFRLLEDS